MLPPVSEFRAPRLPDRDAPPPSLDPAAVAAAMDRIRSHVHRWLDRLEELAGATAEIDRQTEQQRAALQAEIERHQREWEAQVEAIDHDRRLLAEAWERLEHEQIASLAMPRAGAVAAEDPARPPRPAPAAAPAPPPARPAELDDVVDRAILRQFEALRRDVRRTAESRGIAAP